jgi:hypothetical protein
MNDLTLENNRAELTADESEGGILLRIKEKDCKAQIWLDQRGIARLYAFLRDVMPDTEGLNGNEID